ncbi:uncharacterized protein AB9W97_007367 isoform 2-T3 [Spinachia spinachia]
MKAPLVKRIDRETGGFGGSSRLERRHGGFPPCTVRWSGTLGRLRWNQPQHPRLSLGSRTEQGQACTDGHWSSSTGAVGGEIDSLSPSGSYERPTSLRGPVTMHRCWHTDKPTRTTGPKVCVCVCVYASVWLCSVHVRALRCVLPAA